MTTPSRFLDKDTVSELMADMARRPSKLGPLGEAEPAVLAFITEEVAPRLAACGMADQTSDEKGNLIARAGTKQGRRLLLILNAMTQPAYAGSV